MAVQTAPPVSPRQKTLNYLHSLDNSGYPRPASANSFKLTHTPGNTSTIVFQLTQSAQSDSYTK